MLKDLQAKYGDRAGEVMGSIWYHQLTAEKRAEIRAREGKHYGKANEAMAMNENEKKIAEWEIRDHGVNSAPYWPGVGTTFTRWDSVEVGIGYSPKQAGEDALEQLTMAGYAIPEDLADEVADLSDEDTVSSILNQDRPAEKWVVSHYSNATGSKLDEKEFELESEAIKYVESLLAKMKGLGLDVEELEAGEEWEVTEPDDAVMVTDEAGIISIKKNDDEIEEWERSVQDHELAHYVSILIKENADAEVDESLVVEANGKKYGMIVKGNKYPAMAVKSPQTEGKSQIVAGFQYLRSLLDQGIDPDSEEANDYMKEVLGMSHDDIQSAYEMLADEIPPEGMDEAKEASGSWESVSESAVSESKLDHRADQLLKDFHKKVGIEKAVSDKIGEKQIGDVTWRYGQREVSASTEDGLTFIWDVNSIGDKHSYMLFDIQDGDGKSVSESKRDGEKRKITEAFSGDGPGVYVGTYKKYNEGSLKGKWLNPEDYVDQEAFMKAARELHKDEAEPELMFQDYQGFPERFYNESHISEKLWDWLKLDKEDRELLEVYIDEVTNDADSTIDQAREAFLGKYGSETEWAANFIEDAGGLGDRAAAYIYIDDVTARMIGQENGDARVENMSDEEVVTEADMLEEYEKADDEEKEAIVSKAREEVSSRTAKEVEAAIKRDPVGYFVDELGVYTEEDLVKQPFVSIDYEKYARDARLAGDVQFVRKDGDIWVFSKH